MKLMSVLYNPVEYQFIPKSHRWWGAGENRVLEGKLSVIRMTAPPPKLFWKGNLKMVQFQTDHIR